MRAIRLLILSAMVVATVASPAAVVGAADVADEPIAIRAGDDPARVEVAAQLPATGADALPAGRIDQDAGEQVLRLNLVDPATGQAGPPILGRYSRDGRALHFAPRQGLTRGLLYRATLRIGGRDAATKEYRVPPRAPAEPAVVQQIFPSASKVPANLLKFYIHFSKPMREGRDIFDQIHVINDKGQEVNDPWRRIDLWTPDARRLTLWVHPGRVKQGVNLREQLGPVLLPGHKYTLLIDADVLDATGQPLGKPYTKTFTATAEDHGQPSVERWKLSPPPAVGSTAPARAAFPEPLDRWLLERYVSVEDDTGQPVTVRVEVGTHEQSMAFVPQQPWEDRAYVIVVDALLEDLAGNTPGRVFDTDLAAAPPPAAQTRLEFHPAPAK